MQIVAGIDVGNGYVKAEGSIDGGEKLFIDSPSCVSYTLGSDIPAQADQEYIDNLMDNLDVSFSSRAITGADAGRVFVGKRAILSGDSLREFNLEDHQPKSRDALSVMLVLSALTAMAIRQTKQFSGTLNVNATIALALPIEDYVAHRLDFREILVNDVHHVHVHNFEKQLDVVISFDDVVVLAEGAAAQFAIASLGEQFLQLALEDARNSGQSVDKAYTGKILSKVPNTISVDIGEGTVNLPVFQNRKVNIEASRSLPKGYGTVLESVVRALRNTSSSFDSRKDLADFLLEDSKLPARKKMRAVVEKVLNEQVRIFTRDIMHEFTEVFGRVGKRSDVIYVYGGGAQGVVEALRPQLYEAAKLAEGAYVPVIYLDASYSRDLNRKGLFQAATLAKESAEPVESDSKDDSSLHTQV